MYTQFDSHVRAELLTCKVTYSFIQDMTFDQFSSVSVLAPLNLALFRVFG